MNASRTTTVQANNLSQADEAKPGFRTKTISTRLPPDELTEVEAAAERAGQPLSEWLRETALRAARERPADPIELLLAEIWAMRHTVLGLFQIGAQATIEGKLMVPESIPKIRDRADRRKFEEARRMLAEFLSQHARDGGNGR
jgi:hypothetical protein